MGLFVLAGLAVCIIGIIISGKAGAIKDKDLGETKKDASGSEFKIRIGLALAIISGVLSACFSFGIEAGNSMGVIANDAYKLANPGKGEFLFRNNVIFVVILWGGLATNLIWCIILNFRNKSFGDYTNDKTPLLKTIFFVHWEVPCGSSSFSFMAWAKVKWAMEQVPGYYTCRLSY